MIKNRDFRQRPARPKGVPPTAVPARKAQPDTSQPESPTPNPPPPTTVDPAWKTQPYEHPGTLLPKLAEPFGPFDSLLDVGCSEGIVGFGVWKVAQIEALDIYPPRHPPKNFRQGDALDVVSIYGPKAFDVVQCAEMIEHLPKDKGPALLAALEAVAKKLVLITTPNGFDPADAMANLEANQHEEWAKNPYQRHVCGYTPDEFVRAGYEVLLNNTDDGKSQIIAWKDMRGQ